jgi:hypothetical protein
MRAKHIIGCIEGFYEGAKTLSTPQIVLNAAKGNFGVKNLTTRACRPLDFNPFTKIDTLLVKGLHLLSLLCRPQVHKISNLFCMFM